MKQPPDFHDHARQRIHRLRDHRPPWWPENEQWPPHDRRAWRTMRSRNPFFRRLGCLFLIFNFLGFVFFAAVLGLILNFLGVIQISFPQFQSFLPFGVILLVFVMGAILFATRNLRKVSRPLDELVEASGKVADGDFSARVEVGGPHEVRSLLHGFNLMAEKLQVNDQQRRAMLADVSHELRTPITVIQGNVEGILDGMYPADEAHLKSILEETQILSRLVDDLRTMALAESGSLQLRREPTQLAALVQEVVTSLEAQAIEKEISVDLSLADVDDIQVDPLRIREVLSNILSNALRYTPRGGEVQVGLLESSVGLANDVLSSESGSKRGVMVFIHDSGPGIESANLPHIFERFYKSSDSGGMGLGLSIAKYIVEAHGGRIWAESEASKGTRISFSIPA